MGDLPVLFTPRLILSAFTLEDAPRIAEFAGDYDVAEMLVDTPHPYPEGMADAWVDTHAEHWNHGNALYLALRLRGDGLMLGCVELHDIQPALRAELGYWVAPPFWGHGYATEGVHAMISYAFGVLGLQRLDASVFVRNAPSIHILEQAGFQQEGLRPGYTQSVAGIEDVLLYGLRREQFAPDPGAVTPGTTPRSP